MAICKPGREPPPGNQIQFSSVSQLCPTLCDPMDCSTPGLPVYHQLLELAQTNVHQVGDAIQLSHPLSSPSPPAFSHSQHQGLFQMSQFFASGSQRIGVSASTSIPATSVPSISVLLLCEAAAVPTNKTSICLSADDSQRFFYVISNVRY